MAFKFLEISLYLSILAGPRDPILGTAKMQYFLRKTSSWEDFTLLRWVLRTFQKRKFEKILDFWWVSSLAITSNWLRNLRSGPDPGFWGILGVLGGLAAYGGQI